MLHAAPLGHLAPWLPSRSGLYLDLHLGFIYTAGRSQQSAARLRETNEVVDQSRKLSTQHHVDEFLVVELAVTVKVSLAHQPMELLAAEPLTEAGHGVL